MNHKLLIRALMAVILSYFYSCSDNPKEIGENLISDYLKIDTLDSEKDSVILNGKTLKQPADLSVAKRFLIGKYDNIKVSSVLGFKFDLNQNVKNSLFKDSLEIIDIKLLLYPTYFFGEKNASWNLEIYPTYRRWNSNYFTLDTLKDHKLNGIDLSNNLNASIAYSDSLIKISLKNSEVLKILKAEVDSTYRKVYGFYLTSQLSPIIGFPTITSGFSKSLAKLELICKYNNKIDTVYFSLLYDIHVFEQAEFQRQENLLYIQGGTQVASLIFFDINRIPRKATIAKAYLELPIDTLHSKFGKPAEDVYLVRLVTDSLSSSIKYDSTRVLYFKKDQNLIKGNITSYVQSWINGTNNYGVYINAANYFDHCDITAISNGDSRKPKLIIIYAIK